MTSTTARGDGIVVHLVAGSTGAGKTTYSLALAERIGGMRFSIDQWMGTLFWMDSPQPIQYDWTIARIDRCEELIFDTVAKLAALNVPSVLDLGFTRAEHRQKFASLSQASDFALRLHWLDIGADERWARVQHRNVKKGETYNMEVDRDMFDFMESIWEPPAEAEMLSMNGIRVDRDAQAPMAQ